MQLPAAGQILGDVSVRTRLAGTPPEIAAKLVIGLFSGVSKLIFALMQPPFGRILEAHPAAPASQSGPRPE